MCALQISGCHTIGALLLALPLLAVALPTASDVVHVRPSGADQTMESVNAILDDIRDDETVRLKRAGGSGGFDLFGGLKSVRIAEC